MSINYRENLKAISTAKEMTAEQTIFPCVILTAKDGKGDIAIWKVKENSVSVVINFSSDYDVSHELSIGGIPFMSFKKDEFIESMKNVLKFLE